MAETNPLIIPKDQFAMDITTGQAALGDGTTAWASLPKIGLKKPPQDNTPRTLVNGEWVAVNGVTFGSNPAS